MRSPELTVGWDIGGANVKAALLTAKHGGAAQVIDVAQWACPLWQGLDHLRAALDAARAHWPEALAAQRSTHAVTQAVTHAVTMTGEMVDLFDHREAGVRALADMLSTSIAPNLRFFCGDAGWCAPTDAGPQWAQIASANWQATATVAARRLQDGGHVDGPGGHQNEGAVLVDIGSTTTDLIAMRAGSVRATGRSDAQRLARGELLYQGAVRTPLCAIAPHIVHAGERYNVMNEFFATTADVYRLTGELEATHDQHPTADGAPKDAVSTRRRLARMIGLDERDASAADWLAFAQAWRAAQLAALHEEFERVVEAAQFGPRAAIVGAGCGDFLAEQMAADSGRPYLRFESLWSLDDAGLRGDSTLLRRRLQVGAPAAAVGWLRASGWQGAAVPALDRGAR